MLELSSEVTRQRTGLVSKKNSLVKDPGGNLESSWPLNEHSTMKVPGPSVVATWLLTTITESKLANKQIIRV